MIPSAVAISYRLDHTPYAIVHTAEPLEIPLPC